MEFLFTSENQVPLGEIIQPQIGVRKEKRQAAF